MITSILVGVLIILLLLIIFFLYKALNSQLKKVETYSKLTDEYVTFINNIRGDIKNTYLKMKSIDNKEWFFKDDDVGIVFQELLDLIKKLNDKNN